MPIFVPTALPIRNCEKKHFFGNKSESVVNNSEFIGSKFGTIHDKKAVAKNFEIVQNFREVGCRFHSQEALCNLSWFG